MESLHTRYGDVRVLYEDNHILVAIKPPNLLSQADDTGDIDMLSALKEYVRVQYQKPGNVYLGLVHRLDRPVGGVMVFARTSKAASRLSEAFRAHEQNRQYLAVLQGTLSEKKTLSDYLLKDASGLVRAVPENTPGAKRALLTTSPIAIKDNLTLTQVTLSTGRKHQIRAQHSAAGFPLWGDNRYGGGRPGQQIALWAWKIRFTHPTRKEEMEFTSLPPDTGIWTAFHPELMALSDGEGTP